MELIMSTIFTSIKDNVSWISDLFTIMFSAVAAIIGILTYQKAKKSLLQPVKSEVIKKQTEIITNLLKFVSERNGFNRAFDYEGIVDLSLWGLLRDYGFVIKNAGLFEEKLSQYGSGLLVVSSSKKIERFEKDKPIVDHKQKNYKERQTEFGKKKYQELKNGIIDIDILYNTKTHFEFEKQIKEYAGNPFMPTEVSDILNKILSDSSKNVTILIKKSLEEFFIEYAKHFFAGNSKAEISFGGVYNIFNEKRISHKRDEDLIRTKIREFMKVDEDWI